MNFCPELEALARVTLYLTEKNVAGDLFVGAWLTIPLPIHIANLEQQKKRGCHSRVRPRATSNTGLNSDPLNVALLIPLQAENQLDAVSLCGVEWLKSMPPSCIVPPINHYF